jgi:hypothetical protein
MKKIIAVSSLLFFYGAAAFSDSTVAVKLNLQQDIACPINVTSAAEVSFNVVEASDGSANGSSESVAEFSSCGYTFWARASVTKSARDANYRFHATQYGSKDGVNGLGIGVAFCETQDLKRIPTCGATYFTKVDESPLIHASIRINP